jgi:hypothetical protein
MGPGAAGFLAQLTRDMAKTRAKSRMIKVFFLLRITVHLLKIVCLSGNPNPPAKRRKL